MSGSTFGSLFRVTNFGESHGPAIGCVIDGCPPGLALSVEDIQPELDRRRPGTSRHVTQRREPDEVVAGNRRISIVISVTYEVQGSSLRVALDVGGSELLRWEQGRLGCCQHENGGEHSPQSESAHRMHCA